MPRSSNVRPRSRRSCATMAFRCSMSRASSPVNKLLGALWVLLAVSIGTAQSADLNAEQVGEILAAATPDKPADFSGKSLENLDLSKVDFKRANLSGANLFGAKLDGADLSGTNLVGAKLDLAWIMRANFADAD